MNCDQGTLSGGYSQRVWGLSNQRKRISGSEVWVGTALTAATREA